MCLNAFTLSLSLSLSLSLYIPVCNSICDSLRNAPWLTGSPGSSMIVSGVPSEAGRPAVASMTKLELFRFYLSRCHGTRLIKVQDFFYLVYIECPKVHTMVCGPLLLCKSQSMACWTMSVVGLICQGNPKTYRVCDTQCLSLGILYIVYMTYSIYPTSLCRTGNV